MRAPESVAVEIIGTASDWTGRVIACGNPSSCEAAARSAAAKMKPGTGVVSLYSAGGWSDSGSLAELDRIVEARDIAAGSQPAAIDNQIAAASAAVESRAKELERERKTSADRLSAAEAAVTKAAASLASAKAMKPGSPAKKAAGKKAGKKAAKRGR